MDENDRLRDLLSAAQTIVEESDLEVVLRRIVEVAVRLVDAEYGALGVLTPEGDALEQFVFVGIDQHAAERIGALPTGHGLLGQLIVDPRPIRLDRVADHPSAEGFPSHHPPMYSFLGVPVRVRGEVFGNLYLTNRRSGSFTDEDERLVEALAVSAGTALEKARLLQHSRTRERSMAAAAELSAALLASPTDTVFDLIAGRLFDLADVDRVVLALIDDERASARIVATRGLGEAELRGAVISASSRATEAVFAGEAYALGRQPGTDDDPIRISEDGVAGAILVAPLRSRAQLWGAVILARSPRRPRFTEAEVDGIVDFASRASIAWELARAREDQQREDLADDRLRIARDLHDHVIQQLFGTGLLLQAVGSTLPAGSDADAVLDAVARLDDAISQIRTVIFALSRSDGESLRHRILDVVAEESSHRRRPPTLRFVGPVDHAIVGALADDLVAVVRELLSNAVRHADAESIAIDVVATPDSASVIVTDDGRGIPAGIARRGLQNLTDRAESRGGALEVDSEPGRTTATFRVPLPAANDDRR